MLLERLRGMGGLVDFPWFPCHSKNIRSQKSKYFHGLFGDIYMASSCFQLSVSAVKRGRSGCLGCNFVMVTAVYLQDRDMWKQTSLKMRRGRERQGSLTMCVIWYFLELRTVKRGGHQASQLYAKRPEMKFWRTKIETFVAIWTSLLPVLRGDDPDLHVLYKVSQNFIFYSGW